MKKEREGLFTRLLQERHLFPSRGARDGIVLKRHCGLHQNTPHGEFEWWLVMSPRGGQQDSGSVIKTINHGDSHGEG